MLLVLCHSDDIPALWAYRELKARGLQELELVSVESLACAVRWEHRVQTSGDAIDVRLPDQRHIRGDDIRGVLNRMHSVPLHLWRSASEKDREYVHQELLALHLSWLYSLGDRVLNPPAADGLCGAWRNVATWTQLAARAGLPVRRYRLGDENECVGCGQTAPLTSVTVIVVQGTVISHHVPASITASCARLSDLANTPLLGVDLDIDQHGDWHFMSASPFPDLRFGGAGLIDALEHALCAGGVAA
jgi:hypothetical protein